MAKEKAQIEVSLDGSDAVVSDAKQIEAQLNKWGASAANAGKKVGASLLNMAGTALQAGAALQGLSILSAIEQAKQLDLVTAKLGQSAKMSGDSLKDAFNKAEQKTLTSAGAMADFSKALGRSTYDGRFAVDAVSALSEEALAMGRELGDELPLGVALFDLGVKAKDVVPELGRIRDMAEKVGTVGGPTALKDTLAAMGPVLQTVSADTDEARARLEALVAVLGKGLKPQQAQAVASGAIGMIKSKAVQIEKWLGRRVVNDQGEVEDPTRVMADLKRIAQKNVPNKTTRRLGLMDQFGVDLGLAIERTDFAEVDRVAKGAKDRGKTAQEAEAFRKTPEGKRIERQLKVQQTARIIAEKGLTTAENALDSDIGPDGKKRPGLVDVGFRAVTDLDGLIKDASASVEAGPRRRKSPVWPWQTEAWQSLTSSGSTGQSSEGTYAKPPPTGLANIGSSNTDVYAMLNDTLTAMVAEQKGTNTLLRDQVAAGIADKLQRTPLRVQLPAKADANSDKGN